MRIRINQSVTLTRTVFKATLEVANNDAAHSLDKFKVALAVTDEGEADSLDKFGILPPKLTNLTAIDGSASLAAGMTGTMEWTITPTRDAAPMQDTRYFVGGTIEYEQDGTKVSIPIFPAPITVKPDPFLTLRYFLQRDVYSDDPFTDLTEPSEPAALGLLVANQGYGTARNMTITSSQPQIIENEKGLLIDFKIVGSRINLDRITPSLKVDFGNIAPRSTSTATWFLTSTLQGKFIDFTSTFKHVTDLGNERTSLIETTEAHLMEHVVRIMSGDDNKPDFLALGLPYKNTPPGELLPDTIYSSDNSTAPVTPVINAIASGRVNKSGLTVTLNVPNTPTGYAYIRADDPGQGAFRLVAVTRGDGKQILIDEDGVGNAWLTSRTKRPKGRSPYKENRLHLFDLDPTATYTLTYGTPKPKRGSPGDLRTNGDDVPIEFGGPPDGSGGGNGGGGNGGGGGGNGGPIVPGTSGPMVVTALFPNGFYAEAIDQSGGIRIVPKSGLAGVSIGDMVHGTGDIITDPANLERYIAAETLDIQGSGAVEALGLPIKPFYGGDFYYDSGTGAGQKGYADGAGLNATGMLVRTRGFVTGTGAGFFTISDGYKRDVKVLMPPGSIVSPPNVGALVDAMGIVCPEKGGDGRLYPVLRLRSADDAAILTGNALNLPAPSGTLRRSWNLFALPGLPTNSDPLNILGALTTGGILNLDGRLSRYDAPTQAEVFLNASDLPFGEFVIGEGYRVRVDGAAEEANAAGFAFNGYGMDFADAWLSVPERGAARIGHPFPFAVDWQSARVSNGIQTLPLKDASRRIPPFMSSVAEYFDNATQTPLYLGLPEDNKNATALVPWRGYWVTASHRNLALIVPTVKTAAALSLLSPAKVGPGGPGFTLTVTGSGFRTDSVVLWNGSPRPTTFVNDGTLKAQIGASDIANAGTVPIQVATPGVMGVPNGATKISAPLTLTIVGAPRLVLTNITNMTRAGGKISASVTLTNFGDAPATTVKVTGSQIGNVRTLTRPLPTFAKIPAGQTVAFTLSYSDLAGAPGTKTTLSVLGTHSGGTFTTTRKVTLP